MKGTPSRRVIAFVTLVSLIAAAMGIVLLLRFVVNVLHLHPALPLALLVVSLSLGAWRLVSPPVPSADENNAAQSEEALFHPPSFSLAPEEDQPWR